MQDISLKKILSSGLNLEKFGTNNWAFTKKEIYPIIDKLEQFNFAILGGDVYEINNDMPETNYDNWFCERKKK